MIDWVANRMIDVQNALWVSTVGGDYGHNVRQEVELSF